MHRILKIPNQYKLLFLLLVFSTSIKSQIYEDHKVPELEELLLNTTNNRDKIPILDELSWQLRLEEPKQALFYAWKALVLSRQENDAKMEAAALNHIGLYFKNRGAYRTAINFYDSSLEIRQKLHDIEGITGSQNNIGTIYRKMGKYERALSYYEPALERLNKLKSINKEGERNIARILGNIGTCHKYLGNMLKGLEYYQKALDQWKAIGEANGIGEAYNNLGAFYEFQGDWYQATKYYHSAINFFQATLNQREIAKVYTHLGNVLLGNSQPDSALIQYGKSLAITQQLKAPFESAVTIRNIGLVYLNESELDSAQIFLEQAYVVFDTLNAYKDLALTANDLGMVQNLRNNLESSIFFFERGISICDTVEIPFVHQTLLENLASVYAKQDRLSEAYAMTKKSILIREKMMNLTANLRAIEQDLEESKTVTVLSTMLLKQELALKEERAVKLWTVSIALSGGIVLLIILCLLWVKNTHARKKAYIAETRADLAQKKVENHRQKIDTLLDRQKIATLDAELKGQKYERNRIARDLHDNLGGVLSTVMMVFKGLEQNQSTIVQSNYSEGLHLLNEAVEDVRRVAHALSSRNLEKYGLQKVIKDLVHTIESSGEVKIQFIPHGIEERFSDEMESDIYGIVQELLANSLKHSEAKYITLQILNNSGSLDIMVEDDGIGFDVNDPSGKPGMGLENIELRTRKYMGEYWIDSKPGEGTTCCVNLPFENPPIL